MERRPFRPHFSSFRYPGLRPGLRERAPSGRRQGTSQRFNTEDRGQREQRRRSRRQEVSDLCLLTSDLFQSEGYGNGSPLRCASAFIAALSSASFLVRPHAAGNRSWLTCAATLKHLSWSGPCSSNRKYRGVSPNCRCVTVCSCDFALAAIASRATR